MSYNDQKQKYNFNTTTQGWNLKQKLTKLYESNQNSSSQIFSEDGVYEKRG